MLKPKAAARNKQMIKRSLLLLLIVMLSACQHRPPAPVESAGEHEPVQQQTLAAHKTTAPAKTATDWYQVGVHDALQGKPVRDDETLQEWYGDPDVNRSRYLAGYQAGQHRYCRAEKVIALARAGTEFPASCDSLPNANQLHQEWQQANKQPLTP